jgi:hypothetical protein
MGQRHLSGTYTHLFKQDVSDADGTVHAYAGTHGDCLMCSGPRVA